MLVFGKFPMLCVLTNNRFEVGLLNFATVNLKIAWNIYTNKKCIALYYLAFNFSISSFSCDSCESNIDILCAILLPSRKLYAKISTYSLHAKSPYLVKLEICSSFSSFSVTSTKVTWQSRERHQYYYVFIPKHLAKLQAKSKTNLVLIFYLICKFYPGHITINMTSLILFVIHLSTYNKAWSQQYLQKQKLNLIH